MKHIPQNQDKINDSMIQGEELNIENIEKTENEK